MRLGHYFLKQLLELMKVLLYYLYTKIENKEIYHNSHKNFCQNYDFKGRILIANEGLEKIWNRHNANAIKLWNGLENLGMDLHVSSEVRLHTLTTVKI